MSTKNILLYIRIHTERSTQCHPTQKRSQVVWNVTYPTNHCILSRPPLLQTVILGPHKNHSPLHLMHPGSVVVAIHHCPFYCSHLRPHSSSPRSASSPLPPRPVTSETLTLSHVRSTRSVSSCPVNWPTSVSLLPVGPMIGEKQQLVTDEPVEFEKQPVEIQDCTKIADHFRGIYRICPNSIKESRRRSICSRLDSLNQICPKIFPIIWCGSHHTYRFCWLVSTFVDHVWWRVSLLQGYASRTHDRGDFWV